MKLIQLIYASTATDNWPESELRRILDSAVRRNAQNNVTGLLLYSNASFMQILEGDETDVDEAMSRICADTRHTDIVVLSRSAVHTREFGNWSMGFHAVDDADATSWPGFAPLFQHGFDAQKIGATPGLAFDIMKALATAV